MINRIVGQIVDGYPEKSIVEMSLSLHEKGQLCFSVRVSDPTYKFCMGEVNACRLSAGVVSLLIHTHKTEQADTLYGFQTEEERRIFRDLIKIDRLGPATAIKVLGFPIETIRQRIVSGDWKFFTMISGVGEKTGKSLVLELQKKYTRKA